MTAIRRTQHGYPIIAELPASTGGEFIVALAEDSAHRYASWRMDETGHCYGGVYTNDLIEAMADMYDRAKVGFDALTLSAAVKRLIDAGHDPDAIQELLDDALVEHDPNADDENPTTSGTTIPWILEYPNFHVVQTGGGCTAWRHDLGGGAYVMLTNAEGTHHEPEVGGEWIVGYYVNEDDSEGQITTTSSPLIVRATVKGLVGV
jgi:hypothetical protein